MTCVFYHVKQCLHTYTCSDTHILGYLQKYIYKNTGPKSIAEICQFVYNVYLFLFFLQQERYVMKNKTNKNYNSKTEKSSQKH